MQKPNDGIMKMKEKNAGKSLELHVQWLPTPGALHSCICDCSLFCALSSTRPSVWSMSGEPQCLPGATANFFPRIIEQGPPALASLGLVLTGDSPVVFARVCYFISREWALCMQAFPGPAFSGLYISFRGSVSFHTFKSLACTQRYARVEIAGSVFVSSM